MFRSLLQQAEVGLQKRLLAFLLAALPYLCPSLLPIGVAQDTARPRIIPRLAKPRKVWQNQRIISCVAFSPDGKRVAGTRCPNWAKGVILDAHTGGELLSLPQRERSVGSVAYSPDGKFIAWGLLGCSSKHFRGFSAPDNPKDLLLLTDSITGKTVRTFPDQLVPVYQVAFSPDGKLLATTSDNSVNLWDVGTGKMVRELKGHTDHVRDLAFSPDGKHLASVDGVGVLRLWDVASGSLLTTRIASAATPLDNVAFHPDGQIVVTAGPKRNKQLRIDGASINLWNLKDPTKDFSLHGHKEKITGLAFHPDGRHLVSLDEDGILFIWDIKTRKSLYTLHNGNPSSALAISPDGSRLIVVGNNCNPATIWALRANDNNKP